jgi:group I intron endonuclease
MIKSGIYGIRHKISGKIYVGSAISLNRRWNIHLHRLRKNKHHSAHLQAAWNKYEAAAFEFIILELVYDAEKLLDREQYWLDLYGSYNRENGYNISPTAGNSFGIKRTEEFKAKAKISGSKMIFTDEIRRKIRDGVRKSNPSRMRGKKHSEETKLKMKLAHLGYKQTSEHIKNASKARIGTKWSQESRNKQSIAQKLRFKIAGEQNVTSSNIARNF